MMEIIHMLRHWERHFAIISSTHTMGQRSSRAPCNIAYEFYVILYNQIDIHVYLCTFGVYSPHVEVASLNPCQEVEI